ncbi:RNA polymerase subunit sigma-70 [Pedobacter sp. HMWF019]|uniref:RNA polymerase sigma factor n=1 Tax=Pedobacter sp. HMWF019 TaxID=2056856 RepID=UPI000D33DC95|nr:RNA polymerase sigma-70 factor [Pedobacter sp. HMWF019]PTT00075.1 RNA polymerase subunit sigma-70 [Pedobacter sp. HMWF019]
MASYTHFSDEELIALIRERDHSALSEVYNRHWGILYIHALKMTHEESEAQDIVQDVFINLWTNIDKLDLKLNLDVYLFSAVRNRVLNSIRNRKTREGYIDLFSLYVEQHSLDAIDYISEKELLQSIEEIIAALPEKMRMVFELSRRGNKSHKEIAKEMGISEKTVKRQVSNALKILRDKLNRPESLIISIIFYHYR